MEKRISDKLKPLASSTSTITPIGCGFLLYQNRSRANSRSVEDIRKYGLDDAFKVTLYAPKKFDDMSQSERIEACYQHAVLQHLSSQTITNTTLRQRFKLHEKRRTVVSNLLKEVAEKGRIKRKDSESTSSKFAEYVPYWA